MTTQKQMSSIELQDKANEIMENFDFDQVYHYMKTVKWTWYDGEEENGVPSVDQIKRLARSLLTSLVHNSDSCHSVSTGGFQALKFPWGISLNFVIVRSS